MTRRRHDRRWCARDISVDEPHRASRREVFARRRHTARAGSLSEVRQYAGAARDATTPYRGRALPGVSRFDAVDERRRIFLAMVALQNGAIVFAVDGLENDELGREFWLGHVSHPPGIWKSILVRDQRVCEIRHIGTRILFVEVIAGAVQMIASDTT